MIAINVILGLMRIVKALGNAGNGLKNTSS
jgi:hypothetical protein